MPISLNSLSSDHNLITFKINELIKAQTIEIIDYSNTNWPQYKSIITNSLEIPLTITNKNEIDRVLERLTYTLKRAIVKTTINPNREIIPHHLSVISKIKNYFR